MFIDLTTQEKLNIREQSFSGTDLNTSTDKMGIVYSFEPNKLTDKQHTVSSIIDHHDNDICLVKHTEARSVECDSDDEVRYIKNNCIAIEFNESDLIFKKPTIIAQTPYKIQEEVKSKILSFLNTYNQFETKMFVYENNITQSHSVSKYAINDLGYYEPATPKKVLPSNIIKDFKANIRFNINNEDKLIKISNSINNQELSLDLFPKSKATIYKKQILKDIKDKKYKTEEVFDELSMLLYLEVNKFYY